MDKVYCYFRRVCHINKETYERYYTTYFKGCFTSKESAHELLERNFKFETSYGRKANFHEYGQFEVEYTLFEEERIKVTEWFDDFIPDKEVIYPINDMS